MSCVFCDIVSGVNTEHEIIWQDQMHIAFLTRQPASDGHTLVIPRVHTEYVFDMEDEAYQALMSACKSVAGPLKEATGRERVLMSFEGFMVPHVHAHLVPDDRDTNVVRFNSHDASQEELREVANKLRKSFV